VRLREFQILVEVPANVENWYREIRILPLERCKRGSAKTQQWVGEKPRRTDKDCPIMTRELKHSLISEVRSDFSSLWQNSSQSGSSHELEDEVWMLRDGCGLGTSLPNRFKLTEVGTGVHLNCWNLELPDRLSATCDNLFLSSRSISQRRERKRLTRLNIGE